VQLYVAKAMRLASIATTGGMRHFWFPTATVRNRQEDFGSTDGSQMAMPIGRRPSGDVTGLTGGGS
jgi:hypothetical protein